MTIQDMILFIAVVVVTLVGTYAAQVAEKIWKEIQQEAEKEDQLARSSDGSIDRSQAIDINPSSFWKMLGINRTDELPKPLQELSAASDRINLVIDSEKSFLMKQFQQTNDTTIVTSIPIPRLYLLGDINQPATPADPKLLTVHSSAKNIVFDESTPRESYSLTSLSASTQILSSDAIIGNSTSTQHASFYSKDRQLFDFEAQAEPVSWIFQKRYLLESVVFGFLLIAAVFQTASEFSS
jgi:hypothetical protein